MLDNLQHIMTYKTLHALCTVVKRGEGKGRMRAVYYVSCLVYGKAPMWGVWSARTGKFMHFASGREQIAKLHPNLTWRKVMARWQLTDNEDTPASKRREQLTVELEKPKPETISEITAVTLH